MLFKLIEIFNINFLKQNTMKTYFFSFINKQGIPCLNIQVKATSRTEAIEEIAEDVMYILSMVVID